MRSLSLTLLSALVSALLISCGGSREDATPQPVLPAVATPLLSFAIADAPADSVTEVWVTLSSITLKLAEDDDDDDSGITLPILDDNDMPILINLMAYQNGDEFLIINNAEVPVGDYTNLILNTSGCAQNPNGSDQDCWVIDSDTRKPLKTPSNKLRLGGFNVSDEAQQKYTIEFNLRSSLTSTAGGAAFNLKPHGIRIVGIVGSLSGTVDVNLLNPAIDDDRCDTVFVEDTDHGKVVYLYQGDVLDSATLVDEFDPEVALNERPDDAIAPFASDSISFDAEANEGAGAYHYSFSHLPIAQYTVAFSCSAVDDSAEEYNAIKIADPTGQKHTVTIEANTDTVQDFTEI